MTNSPFTKAEVVNLAKNNRVIPLIETLFSGTETPLSIFEKVASKKSGSFLLESAEQGVWSRYSFIGVNNRGMLIQEADLKLKWVSDKSPFPSNQHPALATTALAAVEQLQNAWSSATIEGVPPLTSGLVGLFGWDVIREIEKLPAAKTREYNAPVMCFAMFEDAVILDHLNSSVLIVANVFVEDGADLDVAYDDAKQRIDQLRAQLLEPTPVVLADIDLQTNAEISHRSSKSDFFDSVAIAKEYVRVGDVFQVVISQRFDLVTHASALDVYRVLRSLNPSPYMYLLNFSDENGDFAVIGSSPEALVTVTKSHAVMHPIAGSRPRGKTTDEDSSNSESLLADAKEKAEHLMLVDLARNDLLKVCEPDSVNVTEFMQIHRFSHIMHLVSSVEGEVRAGKSAIDVFRATFPAGTLSGAPKPRALEIIEELEPANRGIFGGVVGYFDFAGNADLAIAIRTAFLRDGVAHVQAGAGIVLDSVSESEYQETIAKASAPIRAIAAAATMNRK